MEKSGFFNFEEKPDGSPDREYFAEDFAKYFASFIGNGVFINPTDQLKVVKKEGTSSDAFKIIVKPGKIFIDGYWYELEDDGEEKVFELAPNVSLQTKKINICAVLDRTKREIFLQEKVIASFDTDLPVVDNSKHEMVLATISIPSNSTSINNSMIEDKRPKTEYCGFVHSVVEQISFDNLFTQFEDAFTEWFDKMKGQLSSDAAGKLQVQIDSVKNKVEISSQTIEKYTNLGMTK